MFSFVAAKSDFREFDSGSLSLVLDEADDTLDNLLLKGDSSAFKMFKNC